MLQLNKMSGKTIKVMVIEDEEILIQAISRKLATLGLEPISCTSAGQAIDYLENLSELPDVIWLDYYLGDENGLEFMRKIRKNKKWSQIPVVVVSNSASEEKKNAMSALGVKKYILKAEHHLEDIVKIIKEVGEKGGDLDRQRNSF